MRTISVSTQKGGVGKTTTAQALAQGLARKGYRTLLIDLDGQQAGLTSVMGASIAGNTAYEVLKGECTIKDAIQHTEQGDIVPRSPNLDRLENEIRARKEDRLAIALENLEGYDWVIIDTPPASGVLVDNALTAADGVIIPTLADVMGLYSLEQFVKTIEDIRRYTNPKLAILGILVTRYSSRGNLTKQIIETLEARAENLGTSVYDAKIRECIAIKEDQASQTNLYARGTKYNSVQDYGALIDEIIEQFEE
ncbi:MAG: ParA family protein [Candidatus Methanomethylophilaceae archaeon]|nr:ParA family protein [Candidatus Methanomethylophilaceae archaeon]